VAAEGVLVAVPSPLTTDAVTRIKNRVEAARTRADGRAEVVVFDFNPQDKDVTSGDFGACYELGEYVANLFDVTTVGYVHARVTGHLTLPVMACKQLAVGPQAAVGEVVAPGEPALTGLKASGHADIAGKVRPAYAAVARKLFDPGVQLRRGKTGGGPAFADLRDPQGVEVTDTAPPRDVPDGKVGLLTARVLRDLGLSNQQVESRQSLLEALDVRLLRDDPLNGRPPVPFKITLSGRVDGGTREMMQRQVREVARQKGNLLFLWLECAGGDLNAARELADDLRAAQNPPDGGEAMAVVAVVPDRAPDAAAVIALGCTEIVMSRRKGAATGGEAVFGDFEAALKQPGVKAEFLAGSLRELAEAQGYPPQVAEGFVLRDAEVLRVHPKAKPTARRLVGRAEFEANKDALVLEAEVKPKGQLLKLTATQAFDLGVARTVVDDARDDPAAVYAKFGLEAAKVREATPAWLDQFANFLRLPVITFLLVVVGFTGLLLELKVPGTTVPGIVAALCFILVFWAYTAFGGQVVILAGLLFLLGIVLVLIEVFVLPGFGFAGIVGLLCMLGALALVTVGGADGVPTTTAGWVAVGGRVAQYLLAMMASLAAAFGLARFLPNIPYANRMMLTAPADRTDSTEPDLPGAAQALSLLGAVGTSVTVLRPAGTVQFGDGYIDVVTEGGFIPAGARVQVVEVEGNRIVVKEV
jgi:membrane-bound ClpP family serine protease